MSEPRRSYPADPGAIGTTPTGATVALHPMTLDAAKQLGAGLAAIDPWARAGRQAADMQNFLSQQEAGAVRYRVMVDDQLAGTLVIRDPWLHGPYLHLFGLLPPFHARGVGGQVLGWFENEAQGHYRNLWLCVSDFNVDARRLYERAGYRLAADLDGLVRDQASELLMRKRLS